MQVPRDVRERVVVDYLAGASSTTLAARYGISHATVLSCVREAGYSVRPRGGWASSTRERDAAIVRARRDGATLRDIGTRFGVTGERVRQIVAAADPTLDTAAAAEAADRRDVAVLRSVLHSHPGRLTWPDLAAASGVPEGRARRLLTDSDVRLLGTHAGYGPQPQWTDSEIHDALRAAADALGPGPLTATRYDQARRDGLVDGPSVALLSIRFGTWTAACRAAGVATGTGRRTPYTSAWTDDDIVDHVADYLACSATSTVAGYQSWRARHAPAAPSWPTVRIRLGPWRVVHRHALQRLLNRGQEPGSSVPHTGIEVPQRMRDAVARAAARAGLPAIAAPDGYDQVRRGSDPTGADITARAGTWGAALAAAGLDPAAAARAPVRIGDVDADAVLRDWAAALPPGEPAHRSRWDRERPVGAPGSWSYVRRYGAWTHTLTALGIPAPTRSRAATDPDLVAAVVDTYLAGESAQTVADQYGVGTSTVLRWVRRAGHSGRVTGPRT